MADITRAAGILPSAGLSVAGGGSTRKLVLTRRTRRRACKREILELIENMRRANGWAKDQELTEREAEMVDAAVARVKQRWLPHEHFA